MSRYDSVCECEGSVLLEDCGEGESVGGLFGTGVRPAFHRRTLSLKGGPRLPKTWKGDRVEALIVAIQKANCKRRKKERRKEKSTSTEERRKEQGKKKIHLHL